MVCNFIHKEMYIMTCVPNKDSEQSAVWPLVYKTFFMLNSAEHDIFPANESQITNNCKFFLAKHSWAWKFLC